MSVIRLAMKHIGIGFPGLRCWCCAALWLSLATAALAQPNAPHVGYAYPAGGRQGATFQVKVGGQFLDSATNIYISGEGVQAKVVSHFKPLTQQQFNNLRDQLKELQDKRQAAIRTGARRNLNAAAARSTNAVWTAADQAKFEEIRKKIATYVRRPSSPAIAESVTLQVTLAADAEPGARELRLGAPPGLSNPLNFLVGQLPEYNKKQPQDSESQPPNRPFRNNLEQKAVAPTETSITLPASVNGQILPGGVDRYRFFARQGQDLVVIASARSLVPYIPDAVPGWFQATLALYDSKGKELAYDDDYRFKPDPVLHWQIPRDGEYLVEIKDAIYRGREDFVYRLTIGELPFITGIFPLGGTAGVATAVEVTGWNLPQNKLTVEHKEPGVYQVSVKKDERLSNLVPFAVDTLPEYAEQPGEHGPDNPQAISMPIIINGRIERAGQWDVFRVEGRAGEPIVAEVRARRLDSPLDSILKITDPAGRQLALNDDFEDKGSGLNTHHADSYLCFVPPTNGAYLVHLGDTQRRGGAEYAYRLRVSPPQPDFELRAVPSSINARAGISVPITVYALRRDGFTNEIALALSEAPRGFTLGGAIVPAGQDKVRITLTPGFTPEDKPVAITLEGRAVIAGRAVSHPAVPADDMEQAFAYHHLVPASALKVTAGGRGFARMPVRVVGDGPVRIPAGGTAQVRLTGPTANFADRFQFELSEPPDGVEIQKISTSRDGTEIVLKTDGEKVKPGLRGNLIVDVRASGNAPAAQKAKKQANQRRFLIGTLPAIPFEIVER